MGGMSPGQRAAAELARDPRRSDAQIGLAARCTPRTVLRVRRTLERRGAIDPVPRLLRAYRRPSRNQGAGERALAQLLADPERTSTAIAADARCSDSTVLAARRALAHTAAMGVNRGTADDPHAARATQEAATRVPARYAIPPDSIEDACPGCTLEWADGGWRHDRACIFRPRPAAREPG